MYSVYIKNPTTGDIWELPYKSVSFTEELNKGSDAQFSFDYTTLKQLFATTNTTVLFALTGGFREIWIQKDTTKIFYGVISDYSFGRDEDSSYSLDVSAVGFFTLFNKRRTGLSRVFSAVDAGTIAWTLINESQLSDPPYSDFGITLGLTATSVNRDRTLRFDNVADVIMKMSKTNLYNGFDFDIDNTKKFNVYYPQKGSNQPNIVLDDRNIVKFSFRKPLIMSLVNKVYVLGAGENDDVLYDTEVSPNDYKAVFGLLEDVVADRQIITVETLIDKGKEVLASSQAPISIPSLSHIDDDPDMLSYNLGDSLPITLPEIEYTKTYRRIYKRSFALRGGMLPVISLYFE